MITAIIITFAVGLLVGVFSSRKQYEKYLADANKLNRQLSAQWSTCQVQRNVLTARLNAANAALETLNQPKLNPENYAA